MKPLLKKIEVLLNTMAACLLALIIYFLGTSFFHIRQNEAHAINTAMYPKGAMADYFPEIDWKRSNKTLILYLQSTCPYCQKSADFHRQLAQIGHLQGLHTIAMFPESATIAQLTLAAEDIHVDEIVETQGRRFGFVGTPTIALIDQGGSVVRAWQGILTVNDKAEVLRELNASGVSLLEQFSSGDQISSGPASLPMDEMSSADLISEEQSGKDIVIVDVRSRDSYKKAHLVRSVNIPTDELEIRAQHELPSGSELAIFCQYQSDCEHGFQQKGMLTNCTMAPRLLNAMGFKSRLLPENLASLEAAGVKVVK